jgi:hypothetical protein
LAKQQADAETQSDIE